MACIEYEGKIIIRAKNSSGSQFLSLSKSDGNFHFTLHGWHKEKYLQIDFDALSESDLKELMKMIDNIILLNTQKGCE